MPGAVQSENLARDPAVVEIVKRDLLPLAQATRDDRVTQRETWLRYHRIWGVTRELAGYQGRTRGYWPIGRRWIDNWVRRVERDLFPDTDWFDIRGLREACEKKVPAAKALQRHWFEKHMQLRRWSSPWLRQMVTLGTSPVLNVWRLDEKDEQLLRDEIDPATGEPTGKWIRSVEKLVRYIGPTFRPRDLFAFYVWPVTVQDVDDATLSFEDLLVSRDRIRAMADTPLDPRNPKAGKVYENWKDLQTLLVDEYDARPTEQGDKRDKYQAQIARLADKGFTHPLDDAIPVRLRPVDLTQHIWDGDLDTGDGVQRWLVTTACDQIVLRVQKNPNWHGGHLHLAGKFVEVLDEFYGRGLPEIFEFMQHTVNDLGDQALDALVWATNPIAIVDAYGVQDPDSLRMAPGAKWLAQVGAVKFAEPPAAPAAAGLQGVQTMIGVGDSLVNVTPAGALGTAQRGRGRSQQTAAGMQMILSESAVDVREVVVGVEFQVMNRLLRRNHVLATQFLDRQIVLKIAGAQGTELLEHAVGVADLVGDFDYQWLGSLTALNQQVRAKQQIDFLAMVTRIPPELLDAQNAEIDFKYLLRDVYGTGMGLRNPERVIRDKVRETGMQPQLENQLFLAGRGAEVKVTPSEPHAEHAAVHDLILRDPRLAPDVQAAVRAHIVEHATQDVLQKLTAQLKAQLQGQQGGAPGGVVGPGGAPNGGPGARLPPPMGPGRVPQTGGFDDLLRGLPRGNGGY